MTSSRFALAAVAGGVAIFVAGGIIYGAIMMNFFMTNTGSASGAMKEQPDWIFLGLGQLAFGLLLTVILDKWARTGGVMTGAQIGAVFGFLGGLAFDFTMFATTNVANITATLVDPFLMAIQMGIGGAAVGAVLGSRS